MRQRNHRRRRRRAAAFTLAGGTSDSDADSDAEAERRPVSSSMTPSQRMNRISPSTVWSMAELSLDLQETPGTVQGLSSMSEEGAAPRSDSEDEHRRGRGRSQRVRPIAIGRAR